MASEIGKPHLKTMMAILENESTPCLHTGGRNSGVMHCGIDYEMDHILANEDDSLHVPISVSLGSTVSLAISGPIADKVGA